MPSWKKFMGFCFLSLVLLSSNQKSFGVEQKKSALHFVAVEANNDAGQNCFKFEDKCFSPVDKHELSLDGYTAS